MVRRQHARARDRAGLAQDQGAARRRGWAERVRRQRFRVRKWWEKSRPVIRTPYRSALVGQRLACLQCALPLVPRGRLWACDDHGVFVEATALVEMMREMTGRDWELPDVSGAPGERACPACGASLVVEVLEGVTVDRCVQHGIWFDPSELESTLEHAAAEPSRSWFRRLFG